MNNIVINDLTDFQVELLDRMWQLDTVDELENFISTLSPEMAKEVRVLQKMLIISHIDDIVDNMTYYPDAEEMLRNIMR